MMTSRRTLITWITSAILAGAAFHMTALRAAGQPPQQQAPERTEVYLTREVHHQLAMLPYYSIFDWFEYRISGYNVELMGYVVGPALKSEAGKAVKGIEGVQKVINNIKVLPPSPMDNHIRLAEYRAIYGYPGFEKYAIQAIGPITSSSTVDM
jgi:hyperosmotically inducible periplasmic protein